MTLIDLKSTLTRGELQSLESLTKRIAARSGVGPEYEVRDVKIDFNTERISVSLWASESDLRGSE